MAPTTNSEAQPYDVMRRQFRQLTEAEQANVNTVKDMGNSFHNFVDSLGSSRETSLAKTKIEEAVMWAVKHLTG